MPLRSANHLASGPRLANLRNGHAKPSRHRRTNGDQLPRRGKPLSQKPTGFHCILAAPLDRPTTPRQTASFWSAMPPTFTAAVGGQGVNTGIQDAYHRKQALILRGDASDILLDTCATEHLPVAGTLVNGTDKDFNVPVSDRKGVSCRPKGRHRGAAVRWPCPAENQATFSVVSQASATYAPTGTPKSTQGWWTTTRWSCATRGLHRPVIRR
ncbi:MAG: FAD-dependent monooxygenase [Mycobacterium sp.]